MGIYGESCSARKSDRWCALRTSEEAITTKGTKVHEEDLISFVFLRVLRGLRFWMCSCGFIIRRFGCAGRSGTYGDHGINRGAERDIRATEDAHGKSRRGFSQGDGCHADRARLGPHARWSERRLLRIANAAESDCPGPRSGAAIDHRAAV